MPTLARNRDAPYRYELEEKLEAGIMLKGAEVKAIREGKASLTGAYISIRGTTATLVNCHIGKYGPSSEELDPDRPRLLLIKKHDLIRFTSRLRGEPLTIIPVSLYTKGGFIKLELALARGKRKADRRESIKKREAQRRIQRALRNRQP